MTSLSYHRTYQPDLRLNLSSLLLTAVSLSVYTLGVCVVWGQTFNPQIDPSQARIAQDLGSIRIAEQEHVPEAERGVLWAHLAAEYWNATDFSKAEGAYNKSLQLLKTAPSARAQYAATLDQLTSFYLGYGRLDDAESAGKQALAVRKKLGNPSGIAVSQVRLADLALGRHQFKKAEGLALHGIRVMESSSDPPAAGLLSAFIALTYARCSRGHCSEGLMNGEQAVAFANRNFESESMATGLALGALGFAEWKSGATQDGEKAMLEGIQILRKKLAPADPRLATAMLQYRAYLVGTNRRAEAQEIQEQVARVISQPGIYCTGCVVSVQSLSNSMR
jgi:tetratricopeptide (TPR) repeat protein